MGIFNFFKNNRSKLDSNYTEVFPIGLLLKIKGRDANLWVATNPKGKKEYFIMDAKICWNTMCMISNNHMDFNPNPDDFVYSDFDVYKVYMPAKGIKKAWIFHTLV